jgi:hypothetical protein
LPGAAVVDPTLMSSGNGWRHSRMTAQFWRPASSRWRRSTAQRGVGLGGDLWDLTRLSPRVEPALRRRVYRAAPPDAGFAATYHCGSASSGRQMARPIYSQP